MSEHARIADLREQRAALITTQREINDKALDEKRDFTAEETQEWDRRDGEITSLSATIARAEKLAGLTVGGEARQVATDDTETRTVTGEVETRTVAPHDTAEYRSAFDSYLRAGVDGEAALDATERRALAVARNADGGYTVPTEWSTKLVEKMTLFSALRQYAFTFATGDGHSIKVDKVVDAMVSAIVAEEGTYSESDDDFGQADLGAFKYGHIVKVSDELLTDSIFDIDAFIRARAARAIALKEGADLIKGDGSNKPNGLTVAATVGVTAASATTTTVDEIIDLYYSVPEPYRSLGTFLVADGVEKVLRKAKDSNGQYLWQPSVAAGSPDTFNNRPIRTDPHIDAPAIDAVTAVFGDLEGYWIRDTGGVSIKVLDQKYADTGQVGYRVTKRTDGDLIDASGIRSLKQAAA